MANESRIIVKFRSDLITIPYQDAAPNVLPAFAAFAWQQLESQFPGVALSLDRTYDDPDRRSNYEPAECCKESKRAGTTRSSDS